MNQKINVGIIFGGKSAEHEISLLSAKNIIQALDRTKFNPILIGVNKKGKLCLQAESRYLLNENDPNLIKLNKSDTETAITFDKENKSLIKLPSKERQKIDVVFPVMHGTYGEDGTIQGLLKFFNLPFVGPSVLGSAIAMDKDVAKRLLTEAGVPNSKFKSFAFYEKNKIKHKELTQELGKILFVKPANLGSSVGVSKVKNKEEFDKAIELAFNYDNKILVEECIKGKELECAVLGLENNIQASTVLAEIIPENEQGFYTYESKYIDESGAQLEIPAKLPEKTIQKIRQTAIKAFKTLNLEIMARVDGFLTKDNVFYVNEANTIPGFTNISMYPKLWEKSGLSQKELITKLIKQATIRHAQEKRLITEKN